MHTVRVIDVQGEVILKHRVVNSISSKRFDHLKERSTQKMKVAHSG